MPTPNAERQRLFRQRKRETGSGSRLDLILPTGAHMALRRLAKHHGISLVELLGRLATAEQQSVLAKLDSKQQNEYFDAVTAA